MALDGRGGPGVTDGRLGSLGSNVFGTAVVIVMGSEEVDLEVVEGEIVVVVVVMVVVMVVVDVVVVVVVVVLGLVDGIISLTLIQDQSRHFL